MMKYSETSERTLFIRAIFMSHCPEGVLCFVGNRKNWVQKRSSFQERYVLKIHCPLLKLELSLIGGSTIIT